MYQYRFSSAILGSISDEGAVISKPQKTQINRKRLVASNNSLLRAENSEFFAAISEKQIASYEK